MDIVFITVHQMQRRLSKAAGVLKRVTVNTLGSALNTCTIYDNTAGSGTIIAVIDPTLARGIFEYDLVFTQD